MSRVRHNLPSLLSDTITAPKLPKKQAAGSDRTDGQVDTGPGVMAHNRRKRNALPLGRDGPARPINKAPVQRKQQQYGKTREDGDEFYTFASRYLAKPFKMGRAVFHIITHAFFTCFGAASLFSLYLYGCQVLGQAVMLVVQNPAKRDAITSDTSAIDSWATKYFTERNTKTTGIFVLLNLWSIMCIPTVALLMSSAISGASRPIKKNPGAWWRNPAQSTKAALKSTILTLHSILHIIMMDAHPHGPKALWRKAKLNTYFLTSIFLFELIIIVEVLRQALSLAYMVTTGSPKSLDQLPDLNFTASALSKSAQAMKPGTIFCILNGLLPLSVLTLSASWSALLHPIKKWHPTENPQYAKNNQARSKGLAKPWSAGCLSSVQLISAVIISTAFIAVLLFFSTVMTDIKERVSNFVGANMVFGLLLPGMGWTLEVFAELLGKVKGSCS